MVRKCRHRWELGCGGNLVRACLDCEKIEDCNKIEFGCEDCGECGSYDTGEVEELDFD